MSKERVSPVKDSAKQRSCKNKGRVLLFPPLTSKGRFLLHKTVEEHFPPLTSFSVGEEPNRRTAVTWSVTVEGRKKQKEKLLNSQRETEGKKVCGSKNNPYSDCSCSVRTDESDTVVEHLDNPQNNVCKSEAGFAVCSDRKYRLHEKEHQSDEKVKGSVAEARALDAENSEIDCVITPCCCRKSEVVECCEAKGKSNGCLSANSSDQVVSACSELLENNTFQARYITVDPENKYTELENHLTRGSAIHSNSVSQNTDRVLEVCEAPCDTVQCATEVRNRDTSHLLCNANQQNSYRQDIHCESRMLSYTMVAETDNEFASRRRSKASAQIYRPPPVRNRRPNEYFQRFQGNIPEYEEQISQQQKYLQEFKECQSAYYDNCDTRMNHTNDSLSNGQLDVSKDCDSRQRLRRPDQQFYTPRRKRSDEAKLPHSSAHIFQDCDLSRPSSPANSVCSVASEFSGRNRYNKYRPDSSFFHDENERLCRKQPFPSTYPSDVDKSHPKPGLFSSETLQLIERCINSEPNKLVSAENSSRINIGETVAQKNKGHSSDNSSFRRDTHPIHSKENLHQSDSGTRIRRGRKQRKRRSVSRDSRIDGRSSSNYHHPLQNSCYDQDQKRQSCSYDNINIISGSQASSRNASLERPTTDNQGYEWRIKDTHHCPGKSVSFNQRYNKRNSTGRPPLQQQCSAGTTSEGQMSSCRRYDNEYQNPSVSSSYTETEEYIGSSIRENFDSSGIGVMGSSARESLTVQNDFHQHFDEQNMSENNTPCNDDNINDCSTDQSVHMTSESSNSIRAAENISRECKNNDWLKHSENLEMVSHIGSSDIVNYLQKSISDINKHSTVDTQGFTNVSRSAPASPCSNDNALQNFSSLSSPDYSLSSQEEAGTASDSYFSGSGSAASSPYLGLQSHLQSLTTTCDDGNYCTDNIQLSSICLEGQVTDENSCKPLQAAEEIYEIEKRLNESSLDESHVENSVTRSLSVNRDDLPLKDVAGPGNEDLTDSSEILRDVGEQIPNTLNDAANPKKFSFNWADEVDDDSWDTLYDDSGNCLDPSVQNQLHNTIGNIKLEKPSHDYYEFKPEEPHINEENYGHMIEIYDFPGSFKTQDLLVIFQEYKSFDIKWVDDTHAIGIFASQFQAQQSLSTYYPFLKTRPMSMAIPASKTKAFRLSEAHLPYKPRPQTSVALARRLVTGALGLKVRVSKEERDAEKNKLKDAKEKKRMIARQREEAWEGTLGNVS